MQLTPHFTLEEALRSDAAIENGIANTPTAEHQKNIEYTAKMMERVRAVLGNNAIKVSSWYRNPQVNRIVGGVANSQHALGLAVDFTCPKFGGILEVCIALRASDIPFDQLIWEYGRWVHIGFCNCPKPRRQVLTKREGKPYVNGLPNA